MKIAMLIWSFWPSPEGGAERQCRLISVGLVRRGFSISVVTSWPGWVAPRREHFNGVEVIRCGCLRPLLNVAERVRTVVTGRPPTSVSAPAATQNAVVSRKRFRLLAPFRWADRMAFILEARHILKRLHADVIHVHESHWVAGVGAWVARELHVPCVCKESTYPAFPRIEADTPFPRFWDRRRREYDRYVTLTDAGARCLAELGVDSQKIVVVPNGVELPDLTLRHPEPSVVLCVGNLTQGAGFKGFDVLITAWASVAAKNPGAQLIIAGRGDAEPWKKMATSLGCVSSIRFVGYCADLATLYSRAAIFVLPSRVEGMSNALLEAQSWGIPCVVTDIPGNRSVVRDGENGVVVPVDDAEALATGIELLLRDPEKRRVMGVLARRNAERRFSIGAVVDKWIDLYVSLTAMRKERRVSLCVG